MANRKIDNEQQNWEPEEKLKENPCSEKLNIS